MGYSAPSQSAIRKDLNLSLAEVCPVIYPFFSEMLYSKVVTNLWSSGSTPCLALSYQLVQCWVLLLVVRLQILSAEKGYGKYDFVV